MHGEMLGVMLGAISSTSALTLNTLITGDSINEDRIKRTTQLAAIIPGSGQIRNKKYWKAPLVWGGMAWCVSVIQFNANELTLSREALIELELTDPATVPNYNSELALAQQRAAFYQRQRDVSWFALIGVHALSILDAHVDANLMEFDVGDDLSIRWKVLTPVNAHHFSNPTLGLVIHWDITSQNFPKFERKLSN